jgi:SAM-dependent methyltransferase
LDREPSAGRCHDSGVAEDVGGRDILERPPELARTFARIGSDYEARPGYPEWVFALLSERCGLRSGAAVLEIGPGTGQATVPMLDRGARITAVEPGAALTQRLTERTVGREIEVVLSRFEDFEVAEAGFDLVVSATAFHWVEPVATGLSKCARALRDDGWLALWWTIWQDPDRPDAFRDALRPVLQAKAPHLLEEEAGPRAYLRDLDARMTEISGVSAFGPMSREILRWEGRHDPVEMRQILGTFAAWIALDEPVRAELLDAAERIAREEPGGTVTRPYQTVFYAARRLPR